MRQSIDIDGRMVQIDVPDDTTPDELDQIVNDLYSEQSAAAPAAAPAQREIPAAARAIYPRTTALGPQAKGLDVAKAVGLDVLSYPGRAIASIPALARGGQAFVEAQGQTKSTQGGVPGFVGDVVRHPSTIPGMLGGAAVAAGAKGLAAIPAVANAAKGAGIGAQALRGFTGIAGAGSRGASLVGAAGRSAAETVPGMLINQADRDQTGQGASFASAAGELALGAAVPFAGAAVKGAAKAVKAAAGKVLQGTGEKILAATFKATKKAYENGFDPKTVTKYRLEGSLDESLEKTDKLIKSLSGELRDKLAGSDATVDVAQAVAEVGDEITANKARQFGANSQIGKAVDYMLAELEEIAPDGVVDLTTANEIKRGVGRMGAWSYGQRDAESSAREAVANMLYTKLRVAIENAAPDGVKEINRQISELIPVEQALIHRIPVAQRNDIISLTDVIGGAGAVLSGPKGWALAIANKLSKSSKVGGALARLGGDIAERAAQPSDATTVGTLSQGALRALGNPILRGAAGGAVGAGIGAANAEPGQELRGAAIGGGTGALAALAAPSVYRTLSKDAKRLAKNQRGQIGARPFDAAGDAAGAAFREKQVRSPEFKKWFGDWEKSPESASKVVDDAGKPLVVYHGTDGDIRSFDTSKSANGAFYFSPDASLSSNYGKKVSPYYIAVKKPFVSPDGLPGAREGYTTRGDFVDALKDEGVDVSDLFSGSDLAEEVDIWELYDSDVIDKLRELGYDGLVLSEEYKPSIAVFSPTQIKSATGNSGAFSPTNPDIRGSIGAAEGSGIDLLTRMAAGGVGGSAAGAMVGNTPEERRRNMLIGAGVGMAGAPLSRIKVKR
jgi:hypothetical protein